MKKDSGKIIILGVLSLIVAIGTLVGAAVLAEVKSRTFLPVFPNNNYVSSDEASVSSEENENPPESSEEPTVDEPASSEETSSETELTPDIETGLYSLEGNSIVVSLSDAGFVEGNVNCGGITMEFSGQTVEGTLIATGTDSLNNTVEITLIFKEGSITASSRPIIQYEESSDYLKLSGIFVK